VNFYKSGFFFFFRRYACRPVGFIADNKVKKKAVFFVTVYFLLYNADNINRLVCRKDNNVAALIFL
jgi:hypothetical protein